MAEIKVEKKNTNIWPWVLGLLLLALAFWGISKMMDRDRDDAGAREGAALELTVPSVAAADPLDVLAA